MAENTAPNVTVDPAKTDEVKPLTDEQLKEIFNSLPDAIKDALNKVNADIDAHNKKVDSLKASEAKDPKLIKAEIFEQNPGNNKKIARLLTEYRKFEEQMEKLRSEAYTIIDSDGLMPAELDEKQIESLKTEVKDSTKSLREQASAMLTFEEMLPMYKGKISPFINEIKTQRAAAKIGGTTTKGDGPKRIRFKKIEVNGVTQDDKGNTVWQKVGDEERYTFTFASQFLNKQHKGISWGSKDLTEAYMKGLDENNLPEVHEFVMPHKFKDVQGNEQTVNYTIKAYR